MGVRDADPVWKEYAAEVEKVEDLIEGREDALEYVRALPGHDDVRATLYRNGAYFLPMTARTAEAMGGLVFAKTPIRNLPAGLDEIVKDVTRTGQDLDRFAETVFDAVLAGHTALVLVDHPQVAAGTTKGVGEALGIRPFLTLYGAEAILAARFTGDGAARKLGHVRLVEEVELPDPDDAWGVVCVEQVRVLDLDEAGFYRQRVFRKLRGEGNVEEWRQEGDDLYPLLNGVKMTAIPAYFTTPRDAEPRPGVPPLRDIADVNIAHLNDSAAYQWGLMWTANPTPVFKNLLLPAGSNTVKLGSAEGLQVGPEGDAFFMEFTGAGLSEIRLAMEAKRRDGAMMGARLLIEDAKSAITAETARIQRAGETSIVVGIANAVSECLTKALTFLSTWAGVEPVTTGAEGATPLEYWLNPDINPAGLTAQQVTALLGAWQGGAITLEDLFKAFQAGEIIDATKTYADHVDDLTAEGDALGTMTDAADESAMTPAA